MDIFISWSEKRSREVAKIFRKYLPAVMQFTRPFLSNSDIDSGTRWNDVLTTRLEAANYGIICLTPENKSSDWIHFESGAISKVIPTARVVPVLFDMDYGDVSYPLLQFQSKKLSVDSIKSIFLSINSLSTTPVDSDVFDLVFDKFASDITKEIKNLPELDDKPDTRSPEEKMFAEILSLMKKQSSKKQSSGHSRFGVMSDVIDMNKIDNEIFEIARLLEHDGPTELLERRVIRLLKNAPPDAQEFVLAAFRAFDVERFETLARRMLNS